MSANYILLETITVGEAGASSISFQNIPQTGYTDLKIVTSLRSTTTTSPVAIKFGSVTTGYSWRRIYGNGSAASSGTDTSNYWLIMDNTNNTGNTFTNDDIYIPNYASSNAKSVSIDNVLEQNGTSGEMQLLAGLCTSTSPISQITFTPLSGNFAQYSTFSLYGLAAVGTTPVIAPYASGGDIIQTDGTYWYHAFLSSGTFTPAKGLSCDVLVVAGGGGGAAGTGNADCAAGGGGAGGYRSATAQALTANTAYTTTVGAGGAGGAASDTNGTVGVNSIFNTITSSGGGYGAKLENNGGSGGSGGGAGGGTSKTGGAGNAGSYSPVEGYAGGNDSGNSGGGGGGATAVGSTASGATGGNGGAGSNAHSSWLSVIGLGISGYLAGGGGGGGKSTGGSAGSGGAGAGGAGAGSGSAATANTGSGGGGGGGILPSSSGLGGKGGSGIVIVRYTV